MPSADDGVDAGDAVSADAARRSGPNSTSTPSVAGTSVSSATSIAVTSPAACRLGVTESTLALTNSSDEIAA